MIYSAIGLFMSLWLVIFLFLVIQNETKNEEQAKIHFWYSLILGGYIALMIVFLVISFTDPI